MKRCNHSMDVSLASRWFRQLPTEDPSRSGIFSHHFDFSLHFSTKFLRSALSKLPVFFPSYVRHYIFLTIFEQKAAQQSWTVKMFLRKSIFMAHLNDTQRNFPCRNLRCKNKTQKLPPFVCTLVQTCGSFRFL